MGDKEIAALCLRLFPEAEILWGEQHLERNPEFALRVTAVHVVAMGLREGADFEQFQSVLVSTHSRMVDASKAARAHAEECAKTEAIRASIRQKRTNMRRGRPGDHTLTEDELAQELSDGVKQ